MTTSTGRRGYVGIDRRWLADERLSDSALRLMLWLDSHSDEYLMALNLSRTADEIGWSRNRVKRTIEDLEAMGLVTTIQLPRMGGGTKTQITLHLGLWSDHGGPSRTSDDGPSRTSAVVHGEARAVVHGGAPTTSTTNVVGTNLQELPLPPFEDWYEQYPKKQGKTEAKKRWLKMTNEQRHAAIAALPGWQRYAAIAGTKFVPMASTWLNQCRWEDEAPVVERTTGPGMTAVRAGLARTAGFDLFPKPKEIER